jgi:hypothetical protein
MPYDAALSTNTDRIRLALGDVDAGREWLPDETYEALLDDASDDLTAATRAAASVLYSVIAMEPVKRTSNGEVIDYSGRLPRLAAIADGSAALPGVITAATSPFTLVPAVYRDTSSNDEFSR